MLVNEEAVNVQPVELFDHDGFQGALRSGGVKLTVVKENNLLEVPKAIGEYEEKNGEHWTRDREDQKYVEEVGVEWIDPDRQEHRNVVSASELLPNHMRQWYGFSDNPLGPVPTRANSHYMSVLFNLPELASDIEKPFDLGEYLDGHFSRLDDGEKPQYGDISILDLHYKGNERNRTNLKKERVQSMVYVNPDLVFIKNRAGPATPYLLRRREDVLGIYKNPSPNVDVEIQENFWRKNYLKV